MMHHSRPSAGIALALALAFGRASATAYVPGSDAEVIEQLPGGVDVRADRTLRAMHALLAKRPDDLDIALRLAQAYVDRARALSDPRPLGQAEAVLGQWWQAADPPVPVLVLRATIRQSTHQFAPARADLERAVARDASNAQAWLTLSTVQLVTGDFEAARAACEHVEALSAAAIGTLCNAAIDGVSGRAQAAYDRVTVLLERGDVAPNDRVRTWASTLAGELAERLDRSADAERWYRASLAIDPGDAYTLAAYADFLLDAGRAADVVALIAADTPIDNLLLRRALADRVLQSADASRSKDALADRFAALHARGDRVHLREEARYTVALAGDAEAALALALDDWAIQKEPLDARIALECAIAAGRPHDADAIVEWIDRTRLEGAKLATLVRRVRAP